MTHKSLELQFYADHPSTLQAGEPWRMNVEKWLRYGIWYIHVMHWFCCSSSFNTRVLIRSVASNLRDVRSELELKLGNIPLL